MNQLKQIQAVTFDVGGTLIKPWPSVGHIYAEVAARHGLEAVSPEQLNRQFTEAWREFKNFNHGREEWAALVDRTFAGVSEEPPSGTFFEELYDRFRAPEAWHIFEDVLPTLDALAALGINLGIVSNWDDRLGPLLKELGLSKYFEAIIISCDVAFAKPSPVIFDHAAKKMGLAPELILHVGDSFERDVLGAKAAGFEAILLDREQAGDGAGRIQTLGELEEMLVAPSVF
ncbi:MAG: haloacid dehalogenase, family protein [Pedosphaera sp.]|nr:haloacid dehalogenase, family protein [Pedosphaera sp.]